ncbi:MAG: peptidase [Ignavibacteriae bacterium]|nr:peptidase [Ignavibacteriota bacterium]NOH00251.1 peptidase [Ignavibacteriota bacterium]
MKTSLNCFKIIAFIFLLLFSKGCICPSDSDVYEYHLIKNGFELNEIETEPGFDKSYVLYISQPLDHFDSRNRKTFKQKLYLNHRDYSLPMVYETNGYEIKKGSHTELPDLLQCNEVVIEHRYFGDSVPDSLDWKYLNIKQAAADQHRVFTLLKTIYKNSWLLTGISKGGQTTMYYNYFYPDDMDATVAYVGPLNLKEEDPKFHEFLRNVGDNKCREKIINFQRDVLKHKDEIIPLLKKYAAQNNYTFDMRLEKTLEYAVLEYSFAFWQWAGTDCESIPVNETDPLLLFDHLTKGSPLSYLDSANIKRLEPFFYQAYTELGYYNYDLAPFKDLITTISGDFAPSKIFAPNYESLVSNHKIMLDVNEFIQTNAKNIIFIYGEYDPWSSSAVDLKENTNCLKMVKEKGSHKTRIKHFDEADRNLIYDKLEEWLGYEIKNKK